MEIERPVGRVGRVVAFATDDEREGVGGHLLNESLIMGIQETDRSDTNCPMLRYGSSLGVKAHWVSKVTRASHDAGNRTPRLHHAICIFKTKLPSLISSHNCNS